MPLGDQQIERKEADGKDGQGPDGYGHAPGVVELFRGKHAQHEETAVHKRQGVIDGMEPSVYKGKRGADGGGDQAYNDPEHKKAAVVSNPVFKPDQDIEEQVIFKDSGHEPEGAEALDLVR